MSYPPPNQPDDASGDTRDAPPFTPTVAPVPDETELDQIR